MNTSTDDRKVFGKTSLKLLLLKIDTKVEYNYYYYYYHIFKIIYVCVYLPTIKGSILIYLQYTPY